MTFDYEKIPAGFYDDILNGPNSMRKFWHYHKFESVLRFIPESLKGTDKKILDVGCFGGSFLGMIDQQTFGEQLGIDMLPGQVEYAQKKYATHWRQFKLNEYLFLRDSSLKNKFHIVTLIEVIEHLNKVQIFELISEILDVLHPEGQLIITTPNYSSLWPFLEFILNLISDIKYEEQHITKFNFFNMEKLFTELTSSNLYLQEKTSTHFLTPYLAMFGYNMSEKLATQIPSAHWKNPFGSIILTSWRKRI